MEHDKLSKVLRIAARILSLPFFSVGVLICLLFNWVRMIIDFARYGGEFITYPDASTRKTIAGVFDALVSLKEYDDKLDDMLDDALRKAKDDIEELKK